MSDRLTQDFDIFYLELKNFTETFKNKSQSVETDKLLSRAGKHEQGEQLKAEHLKNVGDLSERFNAEFGKRVAGIKDSLNGKKKDVALDAIKKKFSKNESLSSDESSRLLLSEMRENKDIMRKSSFQNMLSTADIEQVKKTAQTLSDDKDIEKMEWLKEMVSLKGEEVLSNTLEAQINGVRDSQLSDEQLNLKKVSERIQKGMQLFNYSIERSKTGIFIDARQDDEVQ